MSIEKKDFFEPPLRIINPTVISCHFLKILPSRPIYTWHYLSAIGVGSWYGYLGMLRLGVGEVPGGAFRGHRGWGRALARSLAPAHPDTPRLGSRPTRCSAHCRPRFRPNRGRAAATCIGPRASRYPRPGTRLRPCSGGASPAPSGPAPRLPTYASCAAVHPVALPCKQTTPFRPPQSPPDLPSNPQKIVFFTQKLALCTKNDRIRPGPLKTTYRYI